uniref:Neuron navigator 1 n=1 Tax=Gouania willdenowi TaxID=441366 RepID=A0A8C5HR96_GOUWI
MLLGSSVKAREGDLRMERMDGTKMYGQADGKGVGIAAKKAKPGVPQSTQRGELKVYRAGSSEGRIPVPSNLRKQRSMTNLAVLTDAEKKLHLYEPKWCDDMGKPGAGHCKASKLKAAGGGSSAGGGAPLSRNLSKSEHTLFQGKPRPFSPLAAPSSLCKQSRIPRGPFAEVKPLSKAPEDGKSDDEILSSKAKANAKKTPAGAGGESASKGQGDEDKQFLKVDPELVVTVLGDLEQLLFSQILDPESQRKRTVQNVLDLRQNLEDTMSSLRGTQLSHSSNVGYDSDETNARSISSMSNRSSPLSWRHGQSSPRLQAGDAPSSTGGGYQSDKAGSQYTAHTMPARCSSRLSSASRIELIESLDDTDLKSGYLSDSDLLGKSLPHDDDDDNLANGWDESSSISSGLSDGDGEGSENLSSEEFNASSSLNSLPSTPLGSRRSSSAMLRTDAEKRSLVESGLSWYSEETKAGHKIDSSTYDTGSLKTEAPSKWRKKPPSLSEDFGLKGELNKPQNVGQPGSFKKARNPPVGVTSPITHTSQSMLKVAGYEKPLDKSRIYMKTSGLQRSRSDAGRDHHREHRKPPSGLVKPVAGASFGYRKPPTATGTATVMTAGGSTISTGSSTVGKPPKSSGIPVKPVGGGTPSGRKNSFDGSSEQSFLGLNARNSIQYRSLPRPAKSSTLSVIGRSAARPVSGTIDPIMLSLKPVPMVPSGSRLKESSFCSSKVTSRTSSGPVNQTDREKEKERAKAKAVGADIDCGSLKGEDPQSESIGESSLKLHGLRMLNTKSLGRSPNLAYLDKVNSNSFDSCVTIQDLPPKVPPYSKLQDLASSHTASRLTPSPAPILHIDSSTSHTSESLSLSGSPMLYPKRSGMHRSMESLPLQMSLPSSTRFLPTEMHNKDERGMGTWGASSRTSVNLPDRQVPERVTKPQVHGSMLSLASNASSTHSSQIRKLRRELESSQEKVANLTTQLSANANLVAAFEQSLALMTARLQTLSVSSDQKDSELTELKETIDILKAKNTEAQEIIQGALSSPEITPRELPINRQNSSESISSLTSSTSHSSMGSLKEQEAKKKKKKSWLRSSFNKAFSKKGGKSSGPYADIEEIATPESSAPSSPKVHHEGEYLQKPSALASSAGLKAVLRNVILCVGDEEGDDKVVTELRTELWEKERKLTDIRLEALTSAHQLEQLQDAMTNMQVLENLKAENSHLKTGSLSPCPSPGPSSSVSQSSGLTALGSLSPRQSLAMPKSYSRGLSEGTSAGKSVPFLPSEIMDWVMLDSAVSQAFKVYITKVDPASSLGLSTDSIYSYNMGHIKRVLGGEVPETQPSRCMSRGPSGITVAIKGLKEKCVDSLVFETLIPKPMMQHYISLLLKHRRLVLSGPSGTGKSYLASRLAEYLVDRSAREVTNSIVVTFNMHRQSCKDLQLYLSNLANEIDRETNMSEIPLVIILDDVHDPVSLSELVNGALTCKYHKCPYIIGTSNQPVKMTANHSLHLSFRMVTFSNNVEPANGFLVRYLHRKMMESEDEKNLTNEDLIRVLDWVPKLWYHLHTFLDKHSTSDFLIGPCFFLSCPVTVDEFRSWFIDLWNHSIIPYLQEGAKDGLKVHGQKAVWEDPVEWVRGTLPWPSAQQDQAKLFHLPPPSIGSSSPSQPSEERPHKETPPSSMECDPLMAMLLKLQEAANYIESPDKEDQSWAQL